MAAAIHRRDLTAWASQHDIPAVPPAADTFVTPS